MVARRLIAASLLAARSLATYEPWHMIDVQAVVCPAPTVSADVTLPELNVVQIDYLPGMSMDSPYIISFLRTTNKAMSITFTVTDANNLVVLDNETVSLKNLDDLPAKCTCRGASPITSATGTYPLGYGVGCSAWDQNSCPAIAEAQGLSPGPWCCREWCYVDASCTNAYESSVNEGWFWTYEAAGCNDAAMPPVCPYAAAADPCECINAGSIMNSAMLAKFNTSYGSRCATWDMENCARDYTPDQVDSWCCDSWCYVNSTCSSSVNSYNPGMEDILFWSSKKCEQDIGLEMQCPYTPACVGDNCGCECLNEQMPTANLPTGAPATYGKQCDAHDATACSSYFASGNSLGMWCCQTWCWVGESCQGRRESTMWPGHYFSSTPCEMDQPAVTAITDCAFTPPAGNPCDCINENLAGLSQYGDRFPANYGSVCQVWDSANCSDAYADSWDANANNDWCCDNWCYVKSETCPLAVASGLVQGAFYSYYKCQSTNAGDIYNSSTDTCVPELRRLGSIDGAVDGILDEEQVAEDAAEPRRLSGRRRSGGGGGSFSFSTRRRAPPPSRPADTTRRRTTSPARRRSPSPGPTPPPDVRRRRTVSGRQNGGSLSARRRGVNNGETPNYGYTNRQNLMNNHGGSMPYQTPYGYSGHQAYPSGSRPNVMMYAAGGAAGGLLAGAGGMYLYSQMYDQYGYNANSFGFRRRRQLGTRWCSVPSDCARMQAGNMVECEDCYSACGFCQQMDRCANSAGGCSLQMTSAVNRDDLSATGFVPSQWTPPLKVKITSIVSDDIVTSGPQSVCPPTNAQQAQERAMFDSAFNRTLMEFRPDLFLTLTEQSVTGEDDYAGGGGRVLPGAPLMALLLLSSLLRGLYR